MENVQLRPLTCGALTRDRANPANIGLNDVLGNYSLTLIDSLSTLAILASGPQGGPYTGPRALQDFQDGIEQFALYYGDGRVGPSGRGLRSRGFDLDSKVQVFETVIRGVGGLLSAHLFAIGELPITGYEPKKQGDWDDSNPLEPAPIEWPSGFVYDGQLLRLALDLGQRLLPAFYTTTGIPYPRVNLRQGIPFYPNSPLNRQRGAQELRGRDVTETCSAGAGTLVLEFTVLSRLTGDPRFEQVAKRAFWAIWKQRSSIDLIGSGIDAERGTWIGTAAGIGAGIDSFFEYALKAHILLSGKGLPNQTLGYNNDLEHRGGRAWLDPNTIQKPLTAEENSSDTFLKAWHVAHAAIKRYLYNGWQNPNDDFHHPSYMNGNYQTGAVMALWIDSLGAFYPGLLTLAGELEEAIEAHLLYTALWTRFRALPERWSIREGQVEANIAWWPGRPEFIESTYHLYRATKDPWYLYVGEMVMKDIIARCYVDCGWTGLHDVRTGEKSDRMESFFLGETTKYMYLLFDTEHPLNKLDAPFVFTTEGHPLIIPRSRAATTEAKEAADDWKDQRETVYFNSNFTNECPIPPDPAPFTGSATAARSDLYHAASVIGLHNVPNIHGELEEVFVNETEDGPIPLMRPKTNYTYYPWTLPPTLLPPNGSCHRLPENRALTLQFPRSTSRGDNLDVLFSQQVQKLPGEGLFIASLDALKLQMVLENEDTEREASWRISSVNSISLGRDEVAVVDADLIADMTDPLFNRVREHSFVDLALEYDPALMATSTTTMPSSAPHAKGKKQGGRLTFDENSLISAYKAAIKTVRDRVSLVWPMIQSSQTGSPTVSSDRNDDDAGGHGNIELDLHLELEDLDIDLLSEEEEAALAVQTRVKWYQAATPVGAGAGTLPDSPHVVFASTADPIADPSIPWGKVFVLDGDACPGSSPSIPLAASRQHQVIVVRRGGCTFSEKLASVPSFYPGPGALQLFVVVDDDEDDEGSGLVSPSLEEGQVTPAGLPRYHPIPMVLVRGPRGTFERFKGAVRVGARRRYVVQSRGLRVRNLKVR